MRLAVLILIVLKHLIAIWGAQFMKELDMQ